MKTQTAYWSAANLQPDGFIATLSGFADRIRRNWARRRTHMLLADIDSYLLDDIGIDPSHVWRTRPGAVDWVVQSHSGTARLVFIGR
jgi:hypothetical protein